jgi:hypothetical protein
METTMKALALTLAVGAAAALGAALLTVSPAGAEPKPSSYTLERVVIERDVTLVNMESGGGDFDYNPVTGSQSAPVIVDCPAGKVPLSGGGRMTTSALGSQYTANPVMVLADSRPTATGWSLMWLATGSGMPGSLGTEFTAHVSVVCANP